MKYALIGLIGGVVSGMGLGGGTLLIPLLVIFASSAQHEAQASNLIAYIPAAIAALIIHLRKGRADKEIFKKSILWGILGAVAGTAVSMAASQKILSKAFGAFLLVLAIVQFIAGERKNRQQHRREL